MLTIREKELVSFGASVAAGCKPCTRFHVKKVREAGASDNEIEQAITDALRVRDHARDIMECQAMKLVGVDRHHEDEDAAPDVARMTGLVSIAAAFAVNCTSSLEKHIAAARDAGGHEDDIRSALDAAVIVKGQASTYVDRVGQLKGKVSRLQQLLKELEETQAQLVQSEKMAALGKLVAGVVHEINTPLAVISSSTDVCQRSVGNITAALEANGDLAEVADEKFRRSVKALQSGIPGQLAAVDRLSRIVGGLKSFACLDEALFRETDLHEAMDNTLMLLERDLADRVDIVKEYGDLPLVACYASELNQVFMNLLLNAVQAIEEKGTITIRTFVAEGRVHVEITDDGIGIPSDRLQRLFEPDFKRKGPRVKAGLGLFTSYQIMQKHRGEIRVASTPGLGSTFTVVLPPPISTETRAMRTEY